MNSRLRRLAGALLATALGASILGVTPSAYAANGSVSGTVTASGVPLNTVAVSAYYLDDGSWRYFSAPAGFTDGNGNYSLSLPPGAYRIGFDEFTDVHVDEFYNDVLDVEDGTTIMVADGAPTANIDADLAVGGHITGTVTGPDGLPVPEESVGATAYELVTEGAYSYWDRVAYASTDALGNYDLSGLAAATYRVGFEDEIGDGVLADEFYDDQASVNTAEDIVVGALATVADIDAQLDEASQIAGTVTDAANNALAGADVYAYVNDGSSWDNNRRTAEAVTDANGHYTLNGLAKGTYRVEFEKAFGDDYAYEAWNNKGSIEVGDDIVVGADVTVTGKDAQLVVGEHDPLPFLEGVTIPQISGTPQVGATLTVTAGTWDQADISATYQWFNDAGAIAGATATTYVPTATDVGKSLVVLVEASKPGFQNRTNMSNTAGPIVAASVVAPPVVTPPVVTPPVVAPAPTPAPVISFSNKIDVTGALTVGSTLKLKNFQALVSRTTVTYRIQWYAGSKKIKKATKSKLKVTNALRGKKISVKVSAISGTTSKTVKVKVGKIR